MIHLLHCYVMLRCAHRALSLAVKGSGDTDATTISQLAAWPTSVHCLLHVTLVSISLFY
jgi:hypothetical protein